MRRGLLPADDALAMAQWQHGGGFSVDASVRIAAADRAGRERLLRYCARPPLALDRRREFDPERLLYASNKPGPGGNGPLLLTPLQRLDRLATLVPPPRIHRHRSFGVLAPHSPLRSAVSALARAATTSPPAPKPQPAAEPAHRRHGISEATFYNWKAKYAGMTVSEARRLKELEQENAKLKRLLAEAELDKAALKDLLHRKW